MGHINALKFEIYKDKKDEWRARFRAGNGEIVWVTSEGYVDKSDCNDAIDIIEFAIKDTISGHDNLPVQFNKRIPRNEVEE